MGFTKDYGVFVLKYLIKQELKQALYLKSSTWATSSTDLEQMRRNILNYLTSVSVSRGYSACTSQLAASLFDAFLNRRAQRDALILELIGLVALMIASKQLEARGLSLKEVRTLSKKSCQLSDICTLERFMIVTLKWNLSLVTAADVSWRLPSRYRCDFELAKLADSYAALCYTDAALCMKGPVAIAIGSVCAALRKLTSDGSAEEWLAHLRDNMQIDTAEGSVLCTAIQIKLALGCRAPIIRSSSDSTVSSETFDMDNYSS
jgi:hypothetical protein